jgi:hypothetical protein
LFKKKIRRKFLILVTRKVRLNDLVAAEP